jgi:dTDP-L-rhamnose 4-epimerase
VRILVTGGAGFIGSYVVDALVESGDEVRILDSLDPQVHERTPDYLNAEAELVVGDVRDANLVAKCLDGVDRVVHLAAAVGVGQSMYEIERYTSVNAVGAAVLLEGLVAHRDHIEKIVVASSMSIYGEGLYRCPQQGHELAPDLRTEGQLAERRWELVCDSCGAELEPLPTPETKPLQPTSVYAIGKRDHEELTLAVGRAYGIPATALRFFNVYGPRQALSNPYTGVAAIFAARFLNHRRPVIFEDGLQSRDFVQVRDVAAAVQLALDPGSGDHRAINVATGVRTSVLDVAAALRRALDVQSEPEIRAQYRAGDIRHCVGDATLAATLLGWSARTRFEDGMTQFAGWLADRSATDHVEAAVAALAERGLTS